MIHKVLHNNDSTHGKPRSTLELEPMVIASTFQRPLRRLHDNIEGLVEEDSNS